MDGRTMVKIERTEYFLFFRTIERSRKSPRSFAVPRYKLSELEDDSTLTLNDGGDFAVLRLDKSTGLVDISFYWLYEHNDHAVTGRRQDVSVSYAALIGFDSENSNSDGNNTLKLLSQAAKREPKLVFKGTQNLKAVIAIPLLRHKLFTALRGHFHWPASREIVFYNDREPYSFYFVEMRKDGTEGICGGLILNESKRNPRKSYYSVHT